jgi:hypothetical protein
MLGLALKCGSEARRDTLDHGEEGDAEECVGTANCAGGRGTEDDEEGVGLSAICCMPMSTLPAVMTRSGAT